MWRPTGTYFLTYYAQQPRLAPGVSRSVMAEPLSGFIEEDTDLHRESKETLSSPRDRLRNFPDGSAAGRWKGKGQECHWLLGWWAGGRWLLEGIEILIENKHN